jgi:hypothetical protein
LGAHLLLINTTFGESASLQQQFQVLNANSNNLGGGFLWRRSKRAQKTIW